MIPQVWLLGRRTAEKVAESSKQTFEATQHHASHAVTPHDSQAVHETKIKVGRAGMRIRNEASIDLEACGLVFERGQKRSPSVSSGPVSHPCQRLEGHWIGDTVGWRSDTQICEVGRTPHTAHHLGQVNRGVSVDCRRIIVVGEGVFGVSSYNTRDHWIAPLDAGENTGNSEIMDALCHLYSAVVRRWTRNSSISCLAIDIL